MTKKSYSDTSADKARQNDKKQKNDKKERLAKALRENLLRRKAAGHLPIRNE